MSSMHLYGIYKNGIRENITPRGDGNSKIFYK